MINEPAQSNRKQTSIKAKISLNKYYLRAGQDWNFWQRLDAYYICPVAPFGLYRFLYIYIYAYLSCGTENNQQHLINPKKRDADTILDSVIRKVAKKPKIWEE